MKAYKLTDEKAQTMNHTQWGEGITHETSGEGDLCGPGWLHVYSHPLLAILLNPIHADFRNPRLWECEVSGAEKHDRGLKSGYARVTTVREIPLPVVSVAAQIRFAILCAKQVYTNADWNAWADARLSGKDRTPAYAAAAAFAATAPAYAAATTAATTAAYAAASAYYADFVYYAAYAAATAAAYASDASRTLNLISLAEQALAEEL